ncbi:MAG: hypothetical protein ACR2PI_19380 [Hyphomicrobiaceae bacterium]
MTAAAIRKAQMQFCSLSSEAGFPNGPTKLANRDFIARFAHQRIKAAPPAVFQHETWDFCA